jgi:5-methylcytosine-specific restriction protein A
MKIMIKIKASWSKPANLNGLIGRKKVDWSIFEDGTTIPVDFHEDFNKANGDISIMRGQKRDLILLYEDKQYNALFQNMDRSGISTDTYQIRYDTNEDFRRLLADTFEFSLNYIKNEREAKAPSGKKVYAKIPDDLAEYIDFYETDMPFVYKIEFISRDSEAISNDILRLISELDEQQLESQLSENPTFNNWINTVTGEGQIKVREGLIKVRKYQQSIIKKLKTEYNGACQICGITFGDYNVDISEAHHIEYFSKTANNKPSNIVILCPNHHRLLHSGDAEFDRKNKVFVLNTGIKLPLIVNNHL